MSEAGERYVNEIPIARIKKEFIPTEESDLVHCRFCLKGFASNIALSNHARVEHIDAYASGNPAIWTLDEDMIEEEVKAKDNSDDEDLIRIKTEQVLSEMEPTSIIALASNDVSYIIMKAEGSDEKVKRTRKKLKVDKSKKKIKQAKKKEDKLKKQVDAKGPFECLEPSNVVEDGTCHQVFTSCCEYSIHYRDEHTRRRKGLRCQVCEKPLICAGEEMAAPFTCEVCGLPFQTNKELSEHTTIWHAKLKPFECGVCHKRFTQHGGVLQHMRKHTGDKPYACTFCPKSFSQKSGLDQHLRIHNKVKPFRCVVCNKMFRQSVKQHMRTHTNVAPYQCGICDKRFKQKGHLQNHLKNHNPAVMTEEQKLKYAEQINMMTSEQVVEMETEQVVETEIEQVVETETEQVVETETEQVVETENEQVVEIETEQVVETEIVQIVAEVDFEDVLVGS